MKFIVDDIQVKRLLKAVLLELMIERQDLFFEIILEALAEIGLAEAIHDGRKDKFVGQDKITAILENLNSGDS